MNTAVGRRVYHTTVRSRDLQAGDVVILYSFGGEGYPFKRALHEVASVLVKENGEVSVEFEDGLVKYWNQLSEIDIQAVR